MPLKHLTETILVVILGAVTVLTGILIDTLPLLPQGFIPWAIVFGAALLYPLVLYPLFRSNRADYFLRVLHFLPAGLALLWLIIQLVALRFPTALIVHEWYTWGWTVGGVVIVFILILWFCYQVLRRRTSRFAFLMLLLVPFVALGISSERLVPALDQGLSAALWRSEIFNIAGTGGSFFAGGPWGTQGSSSAGANLSSSGNKAEEEWREKLRDLEERLRKSSSSSKNAVASSRHSSVAPAPRSSVQWSEVGSSQRSSVTSSVASLAPRSSVQWSEVGSSRTVVAQISSRSSAGSVSSRPPVLPSSGPGVIAGLGLLCAALYTGTLHRRAIRRSKN